MRITQLGEQIGAEIVDVDVRGLDEDASHGLCDVVAVQRHLH